MYPPTRRFRFDESAENVTCDTRLGRAVGPACPLWQQDRRPASGNECPTRFSLAPRHSGLAQFESIVESTRDHLTCLPKRMEPLFLEPLFRACHYEPPQAT